MAPDPAPLFLELAGPAAGPRFAMLHAAAPPQVKGLVVYAHPWAEEMNKSRRMAALQSRALAVAGFTVLQLDLHGCGDSAGDFSDASWAGWIDDLVHACGWLRSHHVAAGAEAAGAPLPPLWLWGLRAGCLLACDAARRVDGGCHLLFWQPVVAGKIQLQQFLRLRLASEMASGQHKGLVERLRSELVAGRSIDVAGYTLGPALSRGLDAARLAPPAAAATGRVEWLEISSQPVVELLPASAVTAAQWSTAGWRVGTRAVAGPAFWQTSEIEEAPSLIDATVAALRAAPATEPAAGARGLARPVRA